MKASQVRVGDVVPGLGIVEGVEIHYADVARRHAEQDRHLPNIAVGDEGESKHTDAKEAGSEESEDSDDVCGPDEVETDVAKQANEEEKEDERPPKSPILEFARLAAEAIEQVYTQTPRSITLLAAKKRRSFRLDEEVPAVRSNQCRLRADEVQRDDIAEVAATAS